MSPSGFAVGILVGLAGVGGGAIMTPLLILLFGVQPTHAVGTDLAYATITRVFDSASYRSGDSGGTGPTFVGSWSVRCRVRFSAP